MQLKMRVTKVTKRTEQVSHRDKEPTEARFEDVELEAVAGDPFLGSAAGGARFTIDNPKQLKKLAEGSTVTVTIE